MIAQSGRLAGRGEDHPLDQIDTAHFLGDSVLHLQSRVHFEEIELRRVGVVYELDRARGAIAHRKAELHRCQVQRVARFIGQSWRRRFLDDFLIAALDRTVALAECNHGSMTVAEQLHFDVPGASHEFLEEYTGIAEVAGRETLHGGERLFEVRRRVAAAHADTAAARGALEHHRVADRLGASQRGIEIG